jgi:hypothetical protein
MELISSIIYEGGEEIMIKIDGNKFKVIDASPQEAFTCVEGIIKFLRAKGLDVYEVIGFMSETAYKIFESEEEKDDSDI